MVVWLMHFCVAPPRHLFEVSSSLQHSPLNNASHVRFFFYGIFIRIVSHLAPMPTMKMNFSASLFFPALLFASAGFAQAQQQGASSVIPLTAGVHLIKAEVAANEAQRQKGLMHRRKMGANEGMVFVFDNNTPVCMWMKDTLIPLSVAFIDASSRIVNIEDMEPQKLDSHCAKEPVTYALEMNKGWFRQKNIKPGMQIGGLPPLN